MEGEGYFKDIFCRFDFVVLFAGEELYNRTQKIIHPGIHLPDIFPFIQGIEKFFPGIPLFAICMIG